MGCGNPTLGGASNWYHNLPPSLTPNTGVHHLLTCIYLGELS